MPLQSLSRYSSTPLYNIKAVEQATGVAASTLRVWERRYGIPTPNRNETGYRLYSERDIATITWLKGQLDEGLSISQAVARLEALREEGAEPTISLSAGYVSLPEQGPRSLPILQDDLISALLDFDVTRADTYLGEAFALYPVEMVALVLIQPSLVEIGEGWHRGDVSIAQEHFASAYIRQKIETLLNQTWYPQRGPSILCACAPGEQHEIGLMLLALFVRRRGYHVVYLGPNVPEDELLQTAARLQPAMVCVSASTTEAARAVQSTALRFSILSEPRPLFGYGGRIFKAYPLLRQDISGVYLGDDALASADMVTRLLST